MTEQQYRVVADRDKGDDMDAAVESLEEGDRVTYIYDTDPPDRIVRIERPVPTTDSASRCPDCGHQPHNGRACLNMASDNDCVCVYGFQQPSPHPPTREQINSVVGSVLFNASNYPRPAMPHILGQDIGPLRNKVTDAVLALIQNGAGR